MNNTQSRVPVFFSNTTSHAFALQKLHNASERDRKKLSPVDLSTSRAVMLQLPPLRWNLYDTLPIDMSAKNSGFTVMINATYEKETPFVSSGPLTEDYRFSQIHFHWGEHDETGSGHAVNGTRYPLEMHVVHLKKEFANISEALESPDGIVVMVHLFALREGRNIHLDQLTAVLQFIQEYKGCARLHPTALSELVYPFTNEYFLYWGAVGSPKGNYSILWLVSRNVLPVSSQQLNEFRHLCDPLGNTLVSNSSRPHPLDGRSLFLVSSSGKTNDTMYGVRRDPVQAEGFNKSVDIKNAEYKSLAYLEEACQDNCKVCPFPRLKQVANINVKYPTRISVIDTTIKESYDSTDNGSNDGVTVKTKMEYKDNEKAQKMVTNVNVNKIKRTLNPKHTSSETEYSIVSAKGSNIHLRKKQFFVRQNDPSVEEACVMLHNPSADELATNVPLFTKNGYLTTKTDHTDIPELLGTNFSSELVVYKEDFGYRASKNMSTQKVNTRETFYNKSSKIYEKFQKEHMEEPESMKTQVINKSSNQSSVDKNGNFNSVDLFVGSDFKPIYIQKEINKNQRDSILEILNDTLHKPDSEINIPDNQYDYSNNYKDSYHNRNINNNFNDKYFKYTNIQKIKKSNTIPDGAEIENVKYKNQGTQVDTNLLKTAGKRYTQSKELTLKEMKKEVNKDNKNVYERMNRAITVNQELLTQPSLGERQVKESCRVKLVLHTTISNHRRVGKEKRKSPKIFYINKLSPVEKSEYMFPISLKTSISLYQVPDQSSSSEEDKSMFYINHIKADHQDTMTKVNKNPDIPPGEDNSKLDRTVLGKIGKNKSIEVFVKKKSAGIDKIKENEQCKLTLSFLKSKRPESHQNIEEYPNKTQVTSIKNELNMDNDLTYYSEDDHAETLTTSKPMSNLITPTVTDSQSYYHKETSVLENEDYEEPSQRPIYSENSKRELTKIHSTVGLHKVEGNAEINKDLENNLEIIDNETTNDKANKKQQETDNIYIEQTFHENTVHKTDKFQETILIQKHKEKHYKFPDKQVIKPNTTEGQSVIVIRKVEIPKPQFIVRVPKPSVVEYEAYSVPHKSEIISETTEQTNETTVRNTTHMMFKRIKESYSDDSNASLKIRPNEYDLASIGQYASQSDKYTENYTNFSIQLISKKPEDQQNSTNMQTPNLIKTNLSELNNTNENVYKSEKKLLSPPKIKSSELTSEEENTDDEQFIHAEDYNLTLTTQPEKSLSSQNVQKKLSSKAVIELKSPGNMTNISDGVKPTTSTECCSAIYTTNNVIDTSTSQTKPPTALNGLKLSPIKIETKLTVPKTCPKLNFINHWNAEGDALLENNGKTLRVTLLDKVELPHLHGGPLTGEYEFYELHFHWGPKDCCGAEHEIDDQRYPLEAHFLYVKKEYENLQKALEYTDGVAIVAVILNVGGPPYPLLDEFIRDIPLIQDPNTGIYIPAWSMFAWMRTAVTEASGYFLYKGLLTPQSPKVEAVTWMVFPEPVMFCCQQSRMFRKLKSTKGEFLRRNFRHPQPLNSRPVFYVTT